VLWTRDGNIECIAYLLAALACYLLLFGLGLRGGPPFGTLALLVAFFITFVASYPPPALCNEVTLLVAADVEVAVPARAQCIANDDAALTNWFRVQG
jgi:hypothetical protein